LQKSRSGPRLAGRERSRAVHGPVAQRSGRPPAGRRLAAAFPAFYGRRGAGGYSDRWSVRLPQRNVRALWRGRAA